MELLAKCGFLIIKEKSCKKVFTEWDTNKFNILLKLVTVGKNFSQLFGNGVGKKDLKIGSYLKV